MDADLPVPGLILLVGDRAESISTKTGSVVGIRLRSSEARRVQGIEEVAADLNEHILLDAKLLGDGEVKVSDARHSAVQVSWRSAHALVSRGRESIVVEVICRSISDVIEARPAARLANQIGPLVAVRQQRVGIIHGDRLAALEGDEWSKLPSANHSVEHSVHILAKLLSTPEWQVVDHGEGQTLGRVIGAEAFLQRKICEVLRRTNKPDSSTAAPADPGVASGIGVGKELREGVIPHK